MIEYRIKDLAESRVVVEQPRRSIGAIVFFWISVALCASLVASTVDWSKPINWGPVLPVAAFFVLFGAAMTAVRANWTAGHTLSFDGERGTIEIRDSASGDTVQWPLAECREIKTTELRGSGSSNRTTYRAIVVLHDGAELPVYTGHVKRDRDSIAERLEVLISQVRAAASAPPAVPELPRNFGSSRTGTSTTVQWRTTMRVQSFVSLLGVWLALLTLVVVIGRATLDFGGSFRWLPIAFLALWGLVSSAFLLIGILTQLRMHRRLHTLEISARDITYRAGGGLWPWSETWTLTADQTASVRLLWARGELEFPRQDDARPTHIVVGQASLGDTVRLEQWLQREMSERWGRRVA